MGSNQASEPLDPGRRRPCASADSSAARQAKKHPIANLIAALSSRTRPMTRDALMELGSAGVGADRSDLRGARDSRARRAGPRDRWPLTGRRGVALRTRRHVDLRAASHTMYSTLACDMVTSMLKEIRRGAMLGDVCRIKRARKSLKDRLDESARISIGSSTVDLGPCSVL